MVNLGLSLEDLKDQYFNEVDPKLKIRLLIVIHTLNKTPVTDIANFLLISRDKVYYWLRRFKADGIDGLYTKKRTGRPSVIDYELIKEVLEQSPRDHGYDRDYWNLYIIKDYIMEKMDISVHDHYIYEILKKIGWKDRNKERFDIHIPITQTAHRVTQKHLDMIKKISHMLDAPIERIITENGIKPVLKVVYDKRDITIIEGETENGKLTIKYQEYTD